MILLVNVLNHVNEIDLEARNALNLIKTGRNAVYDIYKIQRRLVFLPYNVVIQMHTQFFSWCRQPVKNAIIRIFPYVRI